MLKGIVSKSGYNEKQGRGKRREDETGGGGNEEGCHDIWERQHCDSEIESEGKSHKWESEGGWRQSEERGRLIRRGWKMDGRVRDRCSCRDDDWDEESKGCLSQQRAAFKYTRRLLKSRKCKRVCMWSWLAVISTCEVFRHSLIISAEFGSAVFFCLTFPWTQMVGTAVRRLASNNLCNNVGNAA